mmetsp:Transcript_23580/g.59278  ORF Transcript_23580/g.59278 Transcript_23580/m.59278 type:complete len:225 (-) Transcript_23580:163-837(-)
MERRGVQLLRPPRRLALRLVRHHERWAAVGGMRLLAVRDYLGRRHRAARHALRLSLSLARAMAPRLRHGLGRRAVVPDASLRPVAMGVLRLRARGLPHRRRRDGPRGRPLRLPLPLRRRGVHPLHRRRPRPGLVLHRVRRVGQLCVRLNDCSWASTRGQLGSLPPAAVGACKRPPSDAQLRPQASPGCPPRCARPVNPQGNNTSGGQVGNTVPRRVNDRSPHTQ